MKQSMMPAFVVASEVEMLDFGRRLAHCTPQNCIIALQGPLGAGKTTLVRGFLRALDHKGIVKSPTYTLVEEYLETTIAVYHFDLYRLQSPLELEAIGIDDYFSKYAICIIEWPECGRGHLPQSDILIAIEYLETGRQLCIQAYTPLGENIIQLLL